MGKDAHPGDDNSPITMHGFSYAGANPINNVDPTGLWYWRILSFVASSFYHSMVETYYEGMFGGNPNRHIEYTIPGVNRRPDMFDSLTGAVFEVEPIYLQNHPGHGAVQAQQYVGLLNNAARGDQLKGFYRKFGVEWHYNWRSVIFKLGTRIDWGEKMRAPFPQAPALRLVADYAQPGLILYWLEPDPAQIALLTTAAIENLLSRYKQHLRPYGWEPGQVSAPAFPGIGTQPNPATSSNTELSELWKQLTPVEVTYFGEGEEPTIVDFCRNILDWIVGK